jgi:hypothetical protein
MASSEFVSVTTMPPNKQLQYNMIQMHTLLKLGYQNIMTHLDNPPRDDLDNFLGYCEAWAATIDNHHDSEGVHPQPASAMPRKLLGCFWMLLMLSDRTSLLSKAPSDFRKHICSMLSKSTNAFRKHSKAHQQNGIILVCGHYRLPYRIGARSLHRGQMRSRLHSLRFVGLIDDASSSTVTTAYGRSTASSSSSRYTRSRGACTTDGHAMSSV